MNVNDFDPKKTALLFFDILNGYYHAAEPAAKARMKPWIGNAVRLMKAGREAGMPVFFAKGNHRPDSATSAVLQTDTDMGLRPWPDGVVKKGKMHVTGSDRSSEVIPELDPRPEDYHIPKYRWSAFYQTYLDLALRARGIDTVIISGGSSDVGVASTIFAGRDMDYNMLVVSDACGTSHDQRAHDLLMTLIFPRMARVRTTDQTLQMIQETRRR